MIERQFTERGKDSPSVAFPFLRKQDNMPISLFPFLFPSPLLRETIDCHSRLHFKSERTLVIHRSFSFSFFSPLPQRMTQTRSEKNKRHELRESSMMMMRVLFALPTFPPFPPPYPSAPSTHDDSCQGRSLRILCSPDTQHCKLKNRNYLVNHPILDCDLSNCGSGA